MVEYILLAAFSGSPAEALIKALIYTIATVAGVALAYRVKGRGW